MPSPERSATCGGCGWRATTSRPSSARAASSSASSARARSVTRGSPSASLRRPRSRAIDGREAGLDDALDAAAAILARARAPLVYGLGQATCEAQRAAVALAEAIGAVIDPAGPLLDGAPGSPTRRAARAPPRWATSATAPTSSSSGVPTPSRRTRGCWSACGFPIRTASSSSSTSGARRPRRRPTRSWSFPPAATSRRCGRCARSSARCRSRRGGRRAGARRARCAAARRRTVAILHHVRGHVEALGAPRARARPLPGHACRGLTLRREGNAAGAEDVLAWQTGYPAAVELRARAPAREPGRAERGGGARARRRRRGARRRLRPARAPAGGGRRAPARDPGRVGRRRARRRRRTRRASRSRPPRPACTGRASCTGSTACRSRCARLLRVPRPGDDDVLRRSRRLAGRVRPA